MTTILAIDPGSERSAWLFLDMETGHPVRATPTWTPFGIDPNDDLLPRLRHEGRWWFGYPVAVVIEWMTPRGMPTSAQEFETLWWAGRFTEAAHPTPVERLPRSSVKKHLCGHMTANDSNIRAALIDRFGGIGGKAAAIGLKASPGPLYGISTDVWAALGVAVTWADQHEEERP